MNDSANHFLCTVTIGRRAEVKIIHLCQTGGPDTFGIQHWRKAAVRSEPQSLAQIRLNVAQSMSWPVCFSRHRSFHSVANLMKVPTRFSSF